MKRLLSLLVLLVSILAVSAQTVTLTFTGRDADNHYLPMNRVVIANVTQGWQETIYYPDTVFTMGGTGIADNVANGDFGLKQNNPNPFTGTTYATLQTTDAGEAILEMTDVNGRVVETWRATSLRMGTHQFRINVATAGIYFLTAHQNGQTSSIKMVNNGQGATNRIEYQNFVDTRNNTKTTANNNAKGVATHPFSVGNDMIYTGYVTVNGTEYQSQMIHQNQFVSETFVLNFNASAPTGLPTVTTDAATNVLGHSATCGGNVTADGGYSVLARGVCWSTSPNPVFNDNHVSCGDGMGAFSGQLTGLEANTTYYVRAYAVNSVGTAYGNQESFTTNNVALPTVITTSITNISQNSATCGGTVTADGGYSVLARGVCWSTSPNPVFNDSHVSCGDGMGAFSAQLTGLEEGTTYYVRAYAVNSVGTAYGNQMSFTTVVAPVDGQPCPGVATVTDVDNNMYNTVQIGSQCWMKENLRTTHYADGTDICYGCLISPLPICRVYPNNVSGLVETFGYLYSWNAVIRNELSSSTNPSGVQGICPNGWHVPSTAEWNQLLTYVKEQPEYVCSECSDYSEYNCISKALAATTDWYPYEVPCTIGNDVNRNNTSGFSVLPAGNMCNGTFGGLARTAYIWSCTESDNSDIFIFQLQNANTEAFLSLWAETFKIALTCSVRCIKN